MSLVSRDQKVIWHPFTQEQTAPTPLPIVRAKGATLYAEDGRKYIDMISSWWVTTHGHCHPAIAEAIAEQAKTLEQVIFAGCTHPKAVELSEKVTQKLPGDQARAFFSDCGSAAVEVALKMAYQYWRNKGEAKRKRFLAVEGGYHGDTLGAMALGRSSGFYEMFGELLTPVHFTPFPETWVDDDEVEAKEFAALAALDDYLSAYGAETAAFIFEPLVQGSGGMRMCRPGFLNEALKKLKAYDILIIADEAMTGFGRTGTLFACEQLTQTPDIYCLAKGLTGGFLPLGLTTCSEGIYEAFLGESWTKALIHGHSFTANPIGCAAGIASLQVFEDESTLDKIKKLNEVHIKCLEGLSQHPMVSKPRALGSIAAFEVSTDQDGYTADIKKTIHKFGLERGLLLRPLGNQAYFMPPACLDPNALEEVYILIREVLELCALTSGKRAA